MCVAVLCIYVARSFGPCCVRCLEGRRAKDQPRRGSPNSEVGPPEGGARLHFFAYIAPSGLYRLGKTTEIKRKGPKLVVLWTEIPEIPPSFGELGPNPPFGGILHVKSPSGIELRALRSPFGGSIRVKKGSYGPLFNLDPEYITYIPPRH